MKVWKQKQKRLEVNACMRFVRLPRLQERRGSFAPRARRCKPKFISLYAISRLWSADDEFYWQMPDLLTKWIKLIHNEEFVFHHLSKCLSPKVINWFRKASWHESSEPVVVGLTYCKLTLSWKLPSYLPVQDPCLCMCGCTLWHRSELLCSYFRLELWKRDGAHYVAAPIWLEIIKFTDHYVPTYVCVCKRCNLRISRSFYENEI